MARDEEEDEKRRQEEEVMGSVTKMRTFYILFSKCLSAI